MFPAVPIPLKQSHRIPSHHQKRVQNKYCTQTFHALPKNLLHFKGIFMFNIVQCKYNEAIAIHIVM